MKACVWVCGGITPIILYLCTKWRSVDSFTTCLLHPEKGVPYQWNKMLGWPDSQSARFGGQRLIHDPAGSQITIPRFTLTIAYSLHGYLHIRRYCLNLQERLLTWNFPSTHTHLWMAVGRK
jgi:hypothetical protein